MAPPRKKEKKEEVMKLAPDGASSGFIRHQLFSSDSKYGLDFWSNCDCNIYDSSPDIEVLGIPWYLRASKRDGFLGVELFHRRTSNSNFWSVDVSAEFCLINVDEKNNSIGQISKTFHHLRLERRGIWKFIKFADVIDEGKGFIQDRKISIEVRFILSNFKGIKTMARIDFTDANEPCHDVALVIEGEKIYVSKQILSLHSPVFKAIFYGNIDDNKKEFELKDVDRKEFIEMLNVIYPSNAKISGDNAMCLLQLADRFQMKSVIDRVESYLMKSVRTTTARKLKLSDQYRLVRLQDHCFDSFDTVKAITDLRMDDCYYELSESIKAFLMEKVMELTEEAEAEAEI